MKKSFPIWEFLGLGFTSLSGTLLHYLYEWSGRNIWIAPFSGVNESTWEHMKLLFFPMFIYAVIQSFFFKDRKDYWCIKCKGSLLGLVLIPGIFYTYNGALGKSPDWFNIAIFFITAAAVYIFETKLYKNNTSSHRLSVPTFCLLVIISLLFVQFTFLTPQIPLFRDPISGTYGLNP
ncbi:MAG: hypothetical protein E7616_08495 [Ruminococcaceae bacterium]|nr:hypothetical protein [Oscillospiraceae bacterium]